MKFSFAFRTPFTKEKEFVEADNYEKALSYFTDNVINKRLPIRVHIDYVWTLDEEGNYIERIV